jgi:hypothetical protein
MEGSRLCVAFFPAKLAGPDRLIFRKYLVSTSKTGEVYPQIKSRHPTLLACLQELLKRLQDRHGEYAQAVTNAGKAPVHVPNVMQTMMMFQQVKHRAKTAQDRAKSTQVQTKVTNKVALETEKENDTAQKEVQELQRVMEPKKVRTHSATADDDEECEKQSCDDWDLTDHRREATHIQNHRSIPLGSHGEVPTPQEGKTDPFSTGTGGMDWVLESIAMTRKAETNATGNANIVMLMKTGLTETLQGRNEQQ